MGFLYGHTILDIRRSDNCMGNPIRQYRPIVKVLKEKKGIPTKIYVSGQEYALVHKDTWKEKKKHG
jgi:delta-aminolevulinic acid dehydratase/porphobilinogen synthase